MVAHRHAWHIIHLPTVEGPFQFPQKIPNPRSELCHQCNRQPACTPLGGTEVQRLHQEGSKLSKACQHSHPIPAGKGTGSLPMYERSRSKRHISIRVALCRIANKWLTLISPSREPDTRSFPSGEKPSTDTAPEWPAYVDVHLC